MMKFFKAVLFLICIPIQHVSAYELSDVSIGFQSGYSVLNRFQAVPISNGFPLTANLGFQWNQKFQTKLSYQWIKSEHAGQSSVMFQSFRLIPGYEFKRIKDHHFLIESGLGYQYANLKNIDTVRDVEWMIGPVYSWNFLDAWSFVINATYAKSLNVSFQHIDIGLGISFRFGHTQLSQPNIVKIHIEEDQDKDNIVDRKDLCPDTKRGLAVDDIGCPLMIAGRGVIDGVVFESDSPRLTATSKSALLPIAETLKKYPNLLFIVEGYTSTITTPSQRLNISKARAVSVMNILISYGVSSDKLQAVGLSDQYPLTDSMDTQDRILNERIEIKWKAQQRLSQR